MTMGLIAALNRLLPPYDYTVLDVIKHSDGPRNLFVQSNESGDIMLVLTAGVREDHEQDLLIHVTQAQVADVQTEVTSLRAVIDSAEHLSLLTRPAVAFTPPQIHEVDHGDIPNSWLTGVS